jgi:hypothetical protein
METDFKTLSPLGTRQNNSSNIICRWSNIIIAKSKDELQMPM